jgi:MASE1 protein
VAERAVRTDAVRDPASPDSARAASAAHAPRRWASSPVLWLAAGFGAARAFLYGAALLGRGPVTAPLPVPLFVPQAVVLPVLLLAPRRRWWLLLCGYYVLLGAQSLVVRGWPVLPLYLAFDVADVLGSLIAALLLRRLIALPPRFGASREVGLYAAGVLAAAAAGATWATMVWVAVRGAPWPFWRAWFLSDALASVLLAPALVLWADALATRTATPRR